MSFITFPIITSYLLYPFFEIKTVHLGSKSILVNLSLFSERIKIYLKDNTSLQFVVWMLFELSSSEGRHLEANVAGIQ